MFKQFENPNEAKVTDETASRSSSEQIINHIAEKTAEKATKVEQKYDQENSTLFSK
jgi:hypothetical protein